MTADYLRSLRLDYQPRRTSVHYLADADRHVEILDPEAHDGHLTSRALALPRFPRALSGLILGYLDSRGLDAYDIGRALGVRPAGTDVAPEPLRPEDVEAHVEAILGDLAAVDLGDIPVGRGSLRRWATVAREAPRHLRPTLAEALAVAHRDAPRWRAPRPVERPTAPARTEAERKAALRERTRAEEIATAVYTLRTYLAAVVETPHLTEHAPGDVVALADLTAAALEWSEEPLGEYLDAVEAWREYGPEREAWDRAHRAYVADVRKREHGGVEGRWVRRADGLSTFVLPDPVADPGPPPPEPDDVEEIAEEIGWTADHAPRPLDSLPRAALRAAAESVLGAPSRVHLDDGRRAYAYTVPATVPTPEEDPEVTPAEVNALADAYERAADHAERLIAAERERAERLGLIRAALSGIAAVPDDLDAVLGIFAATEPLDDVVPMR